MSRQSVLEAAREVVARWRADGSMESMLEAQEALCRAVDDHPDHTIEDGWLCPKDPKPGPLPLAERCCPEAFRVSDARRLLAALESTEATALDPARLPQPSGDLPWRVGRRIPIHLYDAQDHPLGTMLTVADAKRVVEAVNEPPVTRQMDQFDRLQQLNAERQRTLDRIETIADKACGPRPLSTAADNLTRIEAALAERYPEAFQVSDARRLLTAAGWCVLAPEKTHLDFRMAIALVDKLEARVEEFQDRVTAFLALWDRSEEDDPPDLEPAAEVLRELMKPR